MADNIQRQSSAVNKIIQGIYKMLDDYCKNYSTMIYSGIVIADNSDGTWNVQYNGEVHAMKPYKTSPTVGEMVKIFIPNGNQNLSFFM